MPGPMEWAIIGLIVVLLVGAKKLPDLARSVGKASSEFKRGVKEGAEEEPAAPADPQDAKTDATTDTEA
jgi:sec-independent protein translocase protein TatA